MRRQEASRSLKKPQGSLRKSGKQRKRRKPESGVAAEASVRSRGGAGCLRFPDCLSFSEALGATYVIRWCRGEQPLLGGRATTLPVARALLALWLDAFPPEPWRKRDMVREELQRRIRAMEVAEAPRRPAEVLTPYTAPSDVGRSWR